MNILNKLEILSQSEWDFFKKNGYLIKRNFIDKTIVQRIQKITEQHLKNRIAPFELEQEVNYPGSPKTVEEKGGDTIRRLKLAYSRDEVFKNWINNQKVIQVLKDLFQSEKIFFVQSHHNCVMTKQPRFSSETHWHKDTRYWNFANNHLINTWLPLDDEVKENGCLQVIPQSHQWHTPRDLLDERLFLREDLPESMQWIEKAQNVEMKQGDLLFFHAAIFHAAGNNKTQKSKNSAVFTFHSDDNYPIPESNSTNFPEILISQD